MNEAEMILDILSDKRFTMMHTKAFPDSKCHLMSISDYGLKSICIDHYVDEDKMIESVRMPSDKKVTIIHNAYMCQKCVEEFDEQHEKYHIEEWWVDDTLYYIRFKY
jgi:hypothetical protein